MSATSGFDSYSSWIKGASSFRVDRVDSGRMVRSEGGCEATVGSEREDRVAGGDGRAGGEDGMVGGGDGRVGGGEGRVGGGEGRLGGGEKGRVGGGGERLGGKYSGEGDGWYMYVCVGYVKVEDKI